MLLNPAGAQLFGYTSAELLRRNVRMLLPPELRRHHLADFQRTAQSPGDGIVRPELNAVHRDGTRFPISVSMSTWLSGEHKQVSITAHNRRRDMPIIAVPTRLARNDPITGLPNRAATFDQPGRHLGKRVPGTLVMINLDDLVTRGDFAVDQARSDNVQLRTKVLYITYSGTYTLLSLIHCPHHANAVPVHPGFAVRA